MDTLAKLVRKHKLARICRVGVWIIAIVGVAQIASSAYYSWLNYRQMQIEMGPPDQVNQLNQLYSSPTYIFLQFANPVLQTIALYIFYCIALYAASVVFAAISAQAATPATSQPVNTLEPDASRLEEEDIVYTSLKCEEILQGKQQISNHRHQSGEV
jgi:hypothetical protein